MLKLSNTKYFSERGNPIMEILDRYFGIPLVFFKKKNNFKDKRIKSIGILCTPGIGDAVIMPGYRSDVSNLIKGFGIPPLEAMACGCPSIVSNVTSLARGMRR